jgi:hypothetical protein
MVGKKDIQDRSLAMHRLVAEKIREDPARFDRVLPLLRRWMETVSPRTLGYLREWERLAEEGMESCLAFATGESEWATTLRQSSPLSCRRKDHEKAVIP